MLAVPPLDRRLRGIDLFDSSAAAFEPSPEEIVLAEVGAGPVWTVSPGGPIVHRVGAELPEIEPEKVLWSLLGERPIATVAVVHFLRSVCTSERYEAPPLRATFLFDDPNLRWRSYGFISYSDLVAHADAHGYHASIAMIPLDAGRPHSSTAELFSARPDRLSLVFHGNNHIAEELRVLHDDAGARAIAAQARRRIAVFERRTGLSVDRIMTPPHGLCSEEATRALGAVGFDALTGLHPLPWTEHRPTHDALAGWRIAEFVGGCAVIPRIPLESTRASMALRAFLDHPLILYGHHEDLADGLERLAETARTVNDLGDVRWRSVGDIAASNLEQHATGEVTTVRPYSRRVRLLRTLDVRRVCVRAPDDLLANDSLVGWSLSDGRVVEFGDELPVNCDDEIVIQLHGQRDLDPALVPSPAWRPWPKFRRAATEVRDRLLPLSASMRRVASPSR